MSRINNDGLQELIKNIKNPLTSIYDKAERKGSLTWSDMKDEFDFIYRFLDKIENDWDTSETTSDPTVIVNNKVFKAQQ